jgi:hypothetical protein
MDQYRSGDIKRSDHVRFGSTLLEGSEGKDCISLANAVGGNKEGRSQTPLSKRSGGPLSWTHGDGMARMRSYWNLKKKNLHS